MKGTVFCVITLVALGHTVASAKNGTSHVSSASSSSYHSIKSTSQADPSSSYFIQSSFSSSIVAVPTSTPSLTSSSTVRNSPSLPFASTTEYPRTSSVISVTPAMTTIPAERALTIVLNKTNSTQLCLQAVLQVTFEVKYYTRKNNTNETAEVPLNANSHSYKGYCNDTNADFFVKWNEQGNRKGPNNNFSMFFYNDVNENKWDVTEIEAQFETSDSYAFHDAKENIITAKSNGSYFGNVSDNEAYLCNSKNNITIGENVTAMFKRIVLQPFSNKTLATDGVHCPADRKKSDDDDDDTVPIAVGAALGGLVLIVLVAYIIGRRRSNRGYEEV